MADYSCFFCKHFVHLNPDEGYCLVHDNNVSVFSPVCSLFDLEQAKSNEK